MTRQQFFVQVFVATSIAALASVASSSVCHNHGTAKSNFEVQCSKNHDSFNVKMICHSNDWTTRAQVKLNLSSDTEIQFENCTFPSKVKVLNILNSMKIPVITKIVIKNLRWMFHRKSLEGLFVTEFHLVDTDFQEVPFDLMYDVMNMRSFQISNTQLMDIPDFFFGDWAENLTQVNLRHNNLQKIKKSDFGRLDNLTILNLGFNQITEIEPAAFNKLENLKLINLCSNRLRTLPVGIFQRTISLMMIILSDNVFDEFPQDLLANTKLLERFSMDANNGTLSTLPQTLFGNLNNLESISLQSNHLKILPSNLFTGSTQITSIDLDDNELTTLPSGLFDDTRELQYLGISNNRLETLPSKIFGKLNRLRYLHLKKNRLTSLMSEVLEGLESVKDFDASYNNITQIDDRFFLSLKASEIVLSYNQLTFEGHQHAAESQDKNGSSLINTSENKFVPLVRDGLIRRRHLHLDHNNIREFNAGVIKLLKYLHWIDLSNNRISRINLSCLSVEDMLRSSSNDEVYPNYIEINLQRNPFHCDYDIKAFIDQLHGRNGTELQKIIYGYAYYCASPPEMKGRPIYGIALDELSYPLNTSDSMDACTDTCVCRRYPEKQVLSADCSHRNLTSIPARIGQDFANWSIELNMTGNNLQNAPSLSDPPLTNVIGLDLSNNNISQVSIDLFSPKLQLLMLQGNSISRLDSEVLEYLASNNSLHSITLHDNKWICDCGAQHLLNFVQTKFTSYDSGEIICQGSTRKLREFKSSDLCVDWVSIIVCVTLILAIVVTWLVALYYKYQRKIRVWLYSKRWCLWFVTEEELNDDKQYDAFISFSQKDEDFVEKEIVAKLERDPRSYKLCLHNRDWFKGESYPVQISRSVAQSRRTLIVLTPDFLESVWGQIEFRKAHTQALKDNRSRVIIIIHGDIGNRDKLDRDIRDYLLFNTHIKWGEPWFWDKLRYALPHRKESVKYKSRNIDGQYQSVEVPLTNNGANNVALKNDATPMSNASANGSIKLLNSTSSED